MPLFTPIFKENKSPKLTLQIGEILARICSRMGDLAAHYSSIIIPVLLSTASKTNLDELLIASSISAAADLLPLLGFYIHDIQVGLYLHLACTISYYFSTKLQMQSKVSYHH